MGVTEHGLEISNTAPIGQPGVMGCHTGLLVTKSDQGIVGITGPQGSKDEGKVVKPITTILIDNIIFKIKWK